MIKKLLVYLVCLLFFFFFANKVEAAATYNCSVNPTSIPYNSTSFLLNINSDGKLAANTTYDLFIYDAWDSHCIRGGGNDTYCYAHVQASTDENRNITDFQVNQKQPVLNPLRSGSNLVIKMFHASSDVCKDMKIPIKTPTSSGDCRPVKYTQTSSGGKNSLYIKPSNLQENNQYHVWVNACPSGQAAECNGTTLKEFGAWGNGCVSGAQLMQNPDGLFISDQASINKYTLWINSCGGFFGQGEQAICRDTFDLGEDGPVPVTDPNSVACPFCPTGSAWNYATQTCVSSSGEQAGPQYGNCPGGQVCLPGNIGAPKCEPSNAYNYSFSEQNRPPPCPVPTEDGTCPKIESAVGILPTNIAGFTSNLLAIILSLIGGIALILIIVSGYRIMGSQGNPEQLQQAKDQLTAAIVGLLFVIFSLVFVEVIGVDILNLPGFE